MKTYFILFGTMLNDYQTGPEAQEDDKIQLSGQVQVHSDTGCGAGKRLMKDSTQSLEPLSFPTLAYNSLNIIDSRK